MATTLPTGALAPGQTEQVGSKAAVTLLDSLLSTPSLPQGTSITPQAQSVQANELLATPGVTGTVVAGTPTAAITISLFFTSSSKFVVLECAIVTVQFSAINKLAIGLPTILDLPTIIAFFPVKFFNSSNNSILHPRGVHGTKESMFVHNLPVFIA